MLKAFDTQRIVGIVFEVSDIDKLRTFGNDDFYKKRHIEKILIDTEDSASCIVERYRSVVADFRGIIKRLFEFPHRF